MNCESLMSFVSMTCGSTNLVPLTVASECVIRVRHQNASSECVIRVRHQSASSVRLQQSRTVVCSVRWRWRRERVLSSEVTVQQSRTVLEESNKLASVIVAANRVLSSEVTVRQIGTPVRVKSSKNKSKGFPAFISVKQSQGGIVRASPLLSYGFSVV